MKYFLIIIFIIFILLVLPIPLKFTLEYYKNSVHFYFYNKKITFKKRVTKKVSHNIKSTDYIGKLKYYFDTLENLHHKLKYNKFAPRLNISANVNYGFEDAAETAVFFGVFHNIGGSIYHILNNYFIIKQYDFNVTPDYNEIKYEVKIKSIIWISIVNTIYIVILILYTFRKGKEIKASEGYKTSNIESNA